MEWSWKVFFATLLIAVILSAFSQGANNARNIEEYGRAGDYRNNFGATVVGTVFGGALWAGIITLVIGFF